MEPRERIVFAVDTGRADEALDWAKRLKGRVGWFKVGLELFIAAGPDLVRRMVDLGARVFLDIKLHDIPATVEGGLRSAEKLGAELITVHIQAGRAWMEAVSRVNRLRVLGITVLTSQSPDDLKALGQRLTDPAELVLERVGLARQAGLTGVVCSGREAAAARRVLGPEGLIVCPGIRPAWSLVAGDDQARITTPVQAVAAGADLLVIGRPIRAADNPVRAAEMVAEELAGA